MILFVNCCPRSDSRTLKIAEHLLKELGKYQEINLYKENLQPLNEERLYNRTKLIEQSDFNDEIFKYAVQFANANTIVIAAPYWDGSFPSLLKVYLENVYVTGIVSKYNEKGIPVGLCNADKLYYITTSGGVYNPNYSFNYVKDIAINCFGIKNVKLIKAEYLDIMGNNPDLIVENTIKK